MAIRYPLSSLLDVRLFREEKAKRDVRLAQMDLMGARETLESNRQAHEAWQIEKVKETDRRYDRLIGRRVNIEDLERFNRGLAGLEEHSLSLLMAVQKAEENVKTCEVKVEEATDKAKVARQSAAKIEKHREIWQQEAKKEIERAEEREFEDFVPLKRVSDSN